MDINRIKHFMPNTIDNIYYFNKISSTHLYAKKISDFTSSNCIILTDFQTKGIGSHNNIWYSGKNNLLFSVILHLTYPISKFEHLTIEIANIIKKCIFDLYGYILEIKPPNDLYLNSKKICRNSC